MNGSLIIASYAAIVATASVVWQVFLWRSEHVGRLTVGVGAQWSLAQEAISVSITNRNSYDVPLKNASLSLTGNSYASIQPIDLDALGLTKVILARNSVQWNLDRGQLIRMDVNLAKVSEVEVQIHTGVGRSESSLAKVWNLDHIPRQMVTKAIGELSEISYGDVVRVRAASASTTAGYKGRTGTIIDFSQAAAPTFEVMFDDRSSIKVPIADVELVLKYENRLRELD
jgi:hypothetical protein